MSSSRHTPCPEYAESPSAALPFCRAAQLHTSCDPVPGKFSCARKPAGQYVCAGGNAIFPIHSCSGVWKTCLPHCLSAGQHSPIQAMALCWESPPAPGNPPDSLPAPEQMPSPRHAPCPEGTEQFACLCAPKQKRRLHPGKPGRVRRAVFIRLRRNSPLHCWSGTPLRPDSPARWSPAQRCPPRRGYSPSRQESSPRADPAHCGQSSRDRGASP